MLDLTIVIQAGGQSSRMGRDKGLMQFGTNTLVENIFQQIATLDSPVIVVSNQPEEYRFLQLPVFMDVIPEIGALGGIYSGLRYARSAYVLMLGCDMPFIDLGLLYYMFDLAGGSDIVIPVTGDRGEMEPFRAVYAKTCEPAILSAISTGQRRAISFFSDVKVRKVGLGEIRRFDPGLRSFINVNTPEDYARALEIQRGI